jgi:hypothetical protein
MSVRRLEDRVRSQGTTNPATRLIATPSKLSKKSPLAVAIRYALSQLLEPHRHMEIRARAASAQDTAST